MGKRFEDTLLKKCASGKYMKSAQKKHVERMDDYSSN